MNKSKSVPELHPDPKKLRKARRIADLTQKEIGSKMGFSPSMICLFEKGERMLGADDISKWAYYCNVSINDLYSPLQK